MPQTHYIFSQSLTPQPRVWALGGRSSSGEHRWSLAKNPAWQESWDNSLPWLPDCCCCCHDLLLLLQGCLSSLDIPLHSGGLPHCKVWSQASRHTETLLPSRKLLILLECREAWCDPSRCRVTRTPDGSTSHFSTSKGTAQAKQAHTPQSPRWHHRKENKTRLQYKQVLDFSQNLEDLSIAFLGTLWR